MPSAPETPPTTAAIKPPVLRRFVEAAFPKEADLARVAGSVTLSIVIDERGAVGEMKVVDPGPHPSFAQAALDAVKQFEFEPAEVDGKPTAVEITYRYDFVLKRPPPPPPPKESPLSLVGRIVERGTGDPVVGASIQGATATAETDADGRFSLRGLAPGPVNVRVVSPAHHDLVIDEVVEPGRVKEVEYRMNRRRYGSFEAVVRGERQRREVSVHTVEVDEIKTVPGTQGDVLKVIQNFPGVARAPFGLGLLVIRGSAPQDTKVYLDGVEIPLLFHFGALTSVVNSDSLANLEFFPGNFASAYGRAMGGTVDVRTRDPKRAWHGVAHLDLYDGAALVEGPVGKGAFLLSARRSWVDQVLKLALSGSDVRVAPVFYDYQAKVEYPLWGGRASLAAYGARDTLDVATGQVSEQQSEFSLLTQFHRLAGHWQRQIGSAVSNTATLAFGYDGIDNQAAETSRTIQDIWSLSLRDTLTYRPFDSLSVDFGTDTQLRRFRYEAAAPPPPPPAGSGGGAGGHDPGMLSPVGGMNGTGDAPAERETTSGNWLSPGLFLQASWQPSRRLRIQPGLRFDADTRMKREPAWLDPRLAMFYELTDSTTLVGAIGRYSQPPQAQDLTSLFGNPSLGYQRSLHYSLGVRQKLPYDADISLSGYYKDMRSLVTPTRALAADGSALNLSNEGKGRSYGLEILMRRRLVRGLYGWLAYTLSQSERLDDPTLPAYADGWRLFELDQTHILTVVASYQTQKDWTFGTRVRYVSGNPYTPFVGGIFNADTGGYDCVPGAAYSARASAFFQADARVDRRFVFDKWLLSAYLDVQNVTNRKNAEARFANFDCQGYATLNGLPLFPTIGLRGQW